MDLTGYDRLFNLLGEIRKNYLSFNGPCAQALYDDFIQKAYNISFSRITEISFKRRGFVSTMLLRYYAKKGSNMRVVTYVHRDLVVFGENSIDGRFTFLY